jgi:hypothetical protein
MSWTTEKSRLDSRQEQEIFLFCTASRPALGPTQFPAQKVLGIFSLETQRLGLETNHSPTPNAELYFHSPICLHDVMLN